MTGWVGLWLPRVICVCSVCMQEGGFMLVGVESKPPYCAFSGPGGLISPM